MKKLITMLILLPGTGFLAYFLYKQLTGKGESSTPTIDAILAGKTPSTPIIGYTPDITKYTTGRWLWLDIVSELGGSWSGTKWFMVNGQKKALTMEQVKGMASLGSTLDASKYTPSSSSNVPSTIKVPWTSSANMYPYY